MSYITLFFIILIHNNFLIVLFLFVVSSPAVRPRKRGELGRTRGRLRLPLLAETFSKSRDLSDLRRFERCKNIIQTSVL